MNSYTFRQHVWSRNDTVVWEYTLRQVMGVNFDKETVTFSNPKNGQFCTKHRDELEFEIRQEYRWNELSSQLQNILMQEVERTPKYRELMEKIRMLTSQRRYREAQALKMEKEAMLDKVAKAYTKALNSETMELGEIYKQMKDEDVMKIKTALHEIFFLCDIVEKNATEINETLDQWSLGTRLEIFNPIIECGKKARKNLAQMDGDSSEKYQADFGDIADDLARMIRNKTMKLMRMAVAKAGGNGNEN